jgi:hypothetical protein
MRTRPVPLPAAGRNTPSISLGVVLGSMASTVSSSNAEGVGLLDLDHALLADGVHRLGYDLPISGAPAATDGGVGDLDALAWS